MPVLEWMSPPVVWIQAGQLQKKLEPADGLLQPPLLQALTSHEL